MNTRKTIEERINFSNYQPNEVKEINKYLSESKGGYMNAIASARGGETTLLIAPTGSGKSYSIIKTLKEFNVKALFILPNSSNVQQAMQEYNIAGAYGDLSPTEAIEKTNVVVMTWDKTSQLQEIDLSEYIVVIDEIHQTYTDTYRNKAIKNLYEVTKKCKGRLDITATPNKLDFSIYDYIVEYKQISQTKYNVKLYNNVDTKTIIEILNKSNGGALLQNDIKELKYISNMLNKESQVIEANTKHNSSLYDSIMSNSDMGKYGVLLNTTTIVAGVNIYNENITDVVVVGIKDIGTIKQYIARFRGLKTCNVHIFNTFKEENKIYDCEWLVGKYIDETRAIANACNSFLKMDNNFDIIGLDKMPINLNSNIYYNKDKSMYEVDEIYIRSQVYFKYYNSRTIENFKILLHEYFEDIEITNIGVDKDIEEDKLSYKEDLKVAKEEAKEILFKHKEILVGYDEVSKNKNIYPIMNYHRDNNLNMDQVQKDYFKYGVHNLINENSLKSTINLYSKNVLENNFSCNLAWNVALMGNRKRNNVFAKVNNLIYRELKTEYPNVFANNGAVETRVYRFITNEFTVGMSYTKEHIELLSEAFRVIFGDLWSLSSNRLSEIINQIYKIDSKQTRIGTVLEHSFYRNSNPIGGANKKIRVYTIKRFNTIEDLREDFKITDLDKSLDLYISKRKNNVLNSLDDTEKEILIENIF